LAASLDDVIVVVVVVVIPLFNAHTLFGKEKSNQHVNRLSFPR
jgi:hypothetical protein